MNKGDNYDSNLPEDVLCWVAWTLNTIVFIDVGWSRTWV